MAEGVPRSPVPGSQPKDTSVGERVRSGNTHTYVRLPCRCISYPSTGCPGGEASRRAYLLGGLANSPAGFLGSLTGALTDLLNRLAGALTDLLGRLSRPSSYFSDGLTCAFAYLPSSLSRPLANLSDGLACSCSHLLYS